MSNLIAQNIKQFLVLGFLLMTFTIQAQSIEIRGVVKVKSDVGTETLADVNVYLKGTAIGTATNRKGEFKFPRKLNPGDILVFSYLGYKKKAIKLKSSSSFLNVFLEEDDNTLLGALNSNRRYKSKRSKH